MGRSRPSPGPIREAHQRAVAHASGAGMPAYLPFHAPSAARGYAVRSPERAAYPRLGSGPSRVDSHEGHPTRETHTRLHSRTVSPPHSPATRVKGQSRTLPGPGCWHTCPSMGPARHDCPSTTRPTTQPESSRATASCSCRWPARRSWSSRTRQIPNRSRRSRTARSRSCLSGTSRRRRSRRRSS